VGFCPSVAQTTTVREYAFEQRLCARLEADSDAVVARQVGAGVHAPGGRVLDVVLVEPGAEFAERAAITERTIPPAAVESPVGPGRYRPVAEVLDGPPERRERIVEAAVEAGFFERERRGGRAHVRQVVRYPDWFDRIVGVENKPDLGRPGDLERQLRVDASLAVVDEAWLATASHVTGAHLHRIPDAVGVWRIDPETGEREVVRDAEALPVEDSGIEPLGTDPGRTEIRVATATEKTRARRRIAERAYGKGWRPAAYPACARVDPDDAGVPDCPWKGRPVDPARECGRDCPGHDPADPPAVDRAALRAARSPWVADPEGRRRRQSGLDRFGDDD